MKKRIILGVMAVLMSLGITAATAFAGTIPVAVNGDAGFNTKNFDVTVLVEKNHVFHITEKIHVDFFTAKHGIFRYIPFDSEKYNIKNVQVEGADYSVSTESSSGYTNKVIKIGDEDRTIIGKKTYTIFYDMVCYEDKDSEADYFSLDLLPTEWQTSIDKATVTLTLPKAMDMSKVKFYKGIYGSTSQISPTVVDSKKDAKGNFIYNKDTRILSYEAKDVRTYSGLTMSATLKEGYWEGAASHGWAVTVLVIAIGAITALAALLLLLFGRTPHMVKTVEFYPPEGLTSAEIGYVVDGSIETKDISSLIVYFASKGYLEIREEASGATVLIKKQEADKDMKPFARTFFDGLFAYGDETTIEKLDSSFGEKFMLTKEQLTDYYKGKNRIFSVTSKICRVVCTILLFLLPIAAVLLSAWAALKYIWALSAVPVGLFFLVGLIMILYAFDHRDSVSKGKFVALLIIGICLGLLSVSAAAYITFMLTESTIAAVALPICCAITLICTLFMKARTKKSAELQGKILGFRDFIKKAEKDKLEALVADDPAYFYNILPYAYVMGLSDKWIKKFSKIPTQAPSWYSSYNSSRNISAFDVLWMSSIMHRCNHCTSKSVMEFTGHSLDSGGGSIGGGFGGGGFSGGGFGGGGGGSW